MLKQSLVAIALFAAAGPAMAQDAGEIARVQAGESCPGCNLFQADLAYMDLKAVDVSGARLRQSDMQLATFDDWNLKGANLSVSNLFGARFNRADFSGANLERATAVGTYFGRSNFANANLDGANLSGADLSVARGLTQQQLASACGDTSTALPKGMSVPACR